MPKAARSFSTRWPTCRRRRNSRCWTCSTAMPGTRLIAGTHRDLGAEAAAGAGFTADLFYKLDVMRVRIPALRERPEDIPVLFRHYVAHRLRAGGAAAARGPARTDRAADGAGLARQCPRPDECGDALCHGAGRGRRRRRPGAWGWPTDGAGGTHAADRGPGAGGRQCHRGGGGPASCRARPSTTSWPGTGSGPRIFAFDVRIFARIARAPLCGFLAQQCIQRSRLTNRRNPLMLHNNDDFHNCSELQKILSQSVAALA